MTQVRNIYTSSHDADDPDLIIAQARRRAGLPEMNEASDEADNEGEW